MPASTTPQWFEVELPTNIQDGISPAGAGRIETPGATDVYTFPVPAGARVRFESAGASPALTGVDWRLADETGAEVFHACLGCTSPGVVTLSRGGQYTLTVGDDENAGTGTYRVRVEPVP